MCQSFPFAAQNVSFSSAAFILFALPLSFSSWIFLCSFEIIPIFDDKIESGMENYNEQYGT